MRRDRRLAAILQAGAEILGAEGLAACTMRAVAARAGMSAAALYRYVQGREELLYLVQEWLLERAIRSAEAARARRGSLVQLRTFITDHIRRIMAFPAEAQLLEAGEAGLPAVLARRIATKRKLYEDLACDLVEDACRPSTPQRTTTQLRTQMLLGMADRVGRAAARAERPAPPDKLAQRVIEVFLRGVRK